MAIQRARIVTLDGMVMRIDECARERGCARSTLYHLSDPTPTDDEPMLRTERKKQTSGGRTASVRCITPDGRDMLMRDYCLEINRKSKGVYKRFAWDEDQKRWVARRNRSKEAHLLTRS